MKIKFVILDKILYSYFIGGFMKKVIYFFMFLSLFSFFTMCKSGGDKTDNGSTASTIATTSTIIEKSEITTTTTIAAKVYYDANTKIDKRMQFTIDREKITEDELKKLMNNLFTAIEEKIATGDFEGWYNALTKDYKYYINDPKNLKKMSEDSDFLSNRNIKLGSPKDFFQYVVMEARKGKSLKFLDYKYVDKFNVRVICLLDDSLKFAYNFKYEDDSWKLDR